MIVLEKQVRPTNELDTDGLPLETFMMIVMTMMMMKLAKRLVAKKKKNLS